MLTLVLAVQLTAATSASPPATATIRGHVSGTDTNQPLRKAQVRLLQVDIQPGPNAPQSRENRLATTDADAYATITEQRVPEHAPFFGYGIYQLRLPPSPRCQCTAVGAKRGRGQSSAGCSDNRHHTE